jgi:tRNA nucleotidyltransferase/poly(A) polymerase
MNKNIKEKLEKFINKGYKAYVVGGYVRDHLLGNESFDVDIATNALPKEVIDVLDLDSFTNDTYGSLYFEEGKYNFDITTFRKRIIPNSRHRTRNGYRFETRTTIKSIIINPLHRIRNSY